jgi:hypothetical protein
MPIEFIVFASALGLIAGMLTMFGIDLRTRMTMLDVMRRERPAWLEPLAIASTATGGTLAITAALGATLIADGFNLVWLAGFVVGAYVEFQLAVLARSGRLAVDHQPFDIFPADLDHRTRSFG